MRLGLALVLAGWLTRSVVAQVSLFEWDLMGNTTLGSGYVSGESLHVVGPDDPTYSTFCADGHITWFEAVAPVSGHVSVTCLFVNLDWPCHWDGPTWIVDGVDHKPYEDQYINYWCDGTYPMEFDVEAGKPFGLGVWSMDCGAGPGIADYVDLVFTPAGPWADLGGGIDPRIWSSLNDPAPLGENFGAALDAAGDIDGDGVPDLVVGAPASQDAHVHVFSAVSGDLLFSAAGDGMFGEDVAGLGDTNGDGLSDLGVGAPQAVPSSFVFKGQLHVVSGADGTTIVTVTGDKGGASLGKAVDGVGDLDGDGLADLAVGVPFAQSVPGRVELRRGLDGSLLASLPAAAGEVKFGSVLSALGDIDGDGIVDVAVAAPGGDAGEVRVVSAAGATLLAFAGGDDFGTSLAATGDVNLDGVPDLLIGDGPSDFDSGQVLLVSGASGATLSVWQPPPGGTIGEAVAAGDVDSDGVAEVALRAWDGAKDVVEIHAALGPTDPLHVLAGGADFGSALSFFADFDGDGGLDLAVGSPGGDGIVSLFHALDGLGAPILEGTGTLDPGTAVELALNHALPQSSAWMLAGVERLDLPFKGGVLVPDPTVVLLVAVDGQGNATLGFHWPADADVAGLFSVFLQAWIADPAAPHGWTASNALAASNVP